ncbi:hypothetical protein [Thermocatellispora tengchongensis]|uniref:hypothetical protein n=1 Tax=Thermocatellispora tengchongensis TaxID=1073253 RepID=UPI0036312FA1
MGEVADQALVRQPLDGLAGGAWLVPSLRAISDSTSRCPATSSPETIQRRSSV